MKKADGKGMGSIVDTSYLGLVSDQYLRDVVVSGLPGQGMPDFQHHGPKGGPMQAMTDAEITSVVAWLGSHRTPATTASTGANPSENTTQPQPKQSETKSGAAVSSVAQ
jgi:hypothetical protein